MVGSAKKRSCLDITPRTRASEKASAYNQSSSHQPYAAFERPLNHGANNLIQNA